MQKKTDADARPTGASQAEPKIDEAQLSTQTIKRYNTRSKPYA